MKSSDTSKLVGVLYRTFRLPLKQIFSLRDYYATINYKSIENMNLHFVNEVIEELELVINSPDFDFQALLPTKYNNEELMRWCKIHLQDLELSLKFYDKGKFIITEKDIEQLDLPLPS